MLRNCCFLVLIAACSIALCSAANYLNAAGPFSPRSGSGASFDQEGDASIYLTGGALDPAQVYNDVWKFSSNDQNWYLITASAPFSARQAHAQIHWNKILYIIGGADAGQVTNDVWTYDSSTGMWSQTIAPFAPRSGAAVSLWQSNSQLLLTGGSNLDGSVVYNDIWSTMDGKNWQQIQTNGNFPATDNGNLISYYNEQGPCLYLMGGVSYPSPSGYTVWTSTDAGAANWQIQSVNTTIPALLSSPAAVFAIASNAEIFVLPGSVGDDSFTTEVYTYNALGFQDFGPLSSAPVIIDRAFAVGMYNVSLPGFFLMGGLTTGNYMPTNDVFIMFPEY